jgi:hypothetical protein
MITYLGHWLRANKGSSRLGLPVARFEKLDNLIHGLKPVATAVNPSGVRLKMQNCRAPLPLRRRYES